MNPAERPENSASHIAMPEGNPISAVQLFSDESGEAFADAGVPRFNRRLTDKILAAFNHAYSLGEMDLARALWECLVAAEKLSFENDARRRQNQAVDLAAEWVAFVDARDRYREISRGVATDPKEASSALDAMKGAYKKWREQNNVV